jgi:hypothetical protein
LGSLLPLTVLNPKTAKRQPTKISAPSGSRRLRFVEFCAILYRVIHQDDSTFKKSAIFSRRKIAR